MATITIDLNADVIDVRDIIERIEELEAALADWEGDYNNDGSTRHEVQGELETLMAILVDLKGNGGDEQWRGDWYPVTLIRDSYFTDYARELCFETDTIPRNFPEWVEIDWERTALNMRYDYTSTEIDGVTYWYR